MHPGDATLKAEKTKFPLVRCPCGRMLSRRRTPKESSNKASAHTRASHMRSRGPPWATRMNKRLTTEARATKYKPAMEGTGHGAEPQPGPLRRRSKGEQLETKHVAKQKLPQCHKSPLEHLLCDLYNNRIVRKPLSVMRRDGCHFRCPHVAAHDDHAPVRVGLIRVGHCRRRPQGDNLVGGLQELFDLDGEEGRQLVKHNAVMRLRGVPPQIRHARRAVTIQCPPRR